MRIAIVTDARTPHVNGVVRTPAAVRAEHEAMGHAVVAPDRSRTLPCPSYPEARLPVATGAAVGCGLAAFAAEVIHVARRMLQQRSVARAPLQGRGIDTLDERFDRAIAVAPQLDRARSTRPAWRFRWQASADCFVAALAPVVDARRAA